MANIEGQRRVAVCVDVGSDLILLGSENITQIPLAITFRSTPKYKEVCNLLIDGTEDITRKFNELIDTRRGNIPKTAATPYVEVYSRFKSLIDQGFDVFSVHMGDELSRTGKDQTMAAKNIDNSRIIVFNSGTVSMAEGFMGIRAWELAQQGKSISEIYEEIYQYKKRIDLRVLVKDMNVVGESGRVSQKVVKIAKLLNIKPILQIDNDKVENVAKPFFTYSGLKWLADFAKHNMPLEKVAIIHYRAPESAYILHRELKKRGISEEIIQEGPMKPITATHGGRGTVAMTIVREA